MKKYFILFFVLISFCLFACEKKIDIIKLAGFTQGTTYHVSFYLNNSAEKTIIEQQITAELERIDKAISNYRDDSAIELFNAQQHTEPQIMSEEIVNLIEIARSVSVVSFGCYDLTIKPLFDLWGFKKDSFHLPSDTELQQTLALIGMAKLETINNQQLRKTIAKVRVDLSSIGQGYSVDRLARILEAHHIDNYLVEIGGELKARGYKSNGKAWRIALEKPLPNQRKIEKVVVFHSGEPMALMTSGTYRHYFDGNGKRYSHILDARNGKPIEHNTVSVTVLHPDPTVADAWSTALLCLGREAGTKVANQQGIAALYIDQVGDQLLETSTLALTQLQGVTFELPDIQ